MDGHANGNVRLKWEYMEVGYRPDQITVSIFSATNPNVQVFGSNEWPMLLAQLGIEGWEMIEVIPSPKDEREYWYYFKRPLISPPPA